MVGEKKTESVVNCIHCMQYMKKENTEMSFGVFLFSLINSVQHPGQYPCKLVQQIFLMVECICS